MHNEIKKHLIDLREEKYQEFSSSLIPNISNVLGVRIPLLREYARTLYKTKSFNIDEFLRINDNEFMEFVMLQGLLIGMKHSEKNELFNDIENYVPRIDNWAVCDTFCAALKQSKKYHKEMFEFLRKYLGSNNVYELRFGVVMLLNYYVEDEYIDKILLILVSLKHDNYYAQMAIAWALSICYIKYFEKTHRYVVESDITPEILKRTIRKVIESLRPTKEQKDFLRTFIKNKLA